MMSSRIKDQVVWITGASSGIGEALASEYASLGAHVVLSARRTDRIENLASLFRRQYHVRALALPCDVCSAEETKQAVSKIIQDFGKLDVTVANAGFGVVGEVMELNLEDFKRQFDTNIFGLLNTIYAAVPELQKTKGSIALMGSILSYFSGPGRAPYAASKYAVRAISEALEFELKPSEVSVTLINPGLIKSELRKVDNYGKVHDKAPSNYTSLHMDASVAARKMVRAIAKRKREVVITAHGKALVFIAKHFSFLIRMMFRLGINGRKAVKSD